MRTIDLGVCPFVVRDEETAKMAGEWAQRMAESILLESKDVEEEAPESL